MDMARAPGQVRDAILRYMSTVGSQEVSVKDIGSAVAKEIGQVAPSSIRSYLNLNVPSKFVRTGRGMYRLKKKAL
jgi:hypothetical protein